MNSLVGGITLLFFGLKISMRASNCSQVYKEPHIGWGTTTSGMHVALPLFKTNNI